MDNVLHCPFNCLPPEIISEIFYQCIRLLEFSFTRDTSFQPFKLSVVCSKWRTIALSLPVIWSAISIYAVPGRINDQLQRLEHQISRSGNRPLSIIIWSLESYDWEYTEKASMLLAALHPYASRWRTLSLLLNAPYLSLKDLPGPNVPLPLLTNLAIFDPHVYQREHSILSLPSCTTLQTLTVTSAYVIYLDIPHAPHTLTSMTLHLCCVSECIYVLYTFPCLESAKFWQFIVPPTEANHIARPILPLTLLHLRTLTLEDIRLPGRAATFLQSIRTPNLTHFSYDNSRWHDHTISEFIAQCPKLTSLSLHNLRDMQHDCLLQLLQACNSITTLNVDISPEPGSSLPWFNDDFLNLLRPSMAERMGPTGLLPKLDTLTFSGQQAFTWPVFLAVWSERSIAESHPAQQHADRPWRQWKKWCIALKGNSSIKLQEWQDEFQRIRSESGGRLTLESTVT